MLPLLSEKLFILSIFPTFYIHTYFKMGGEKKKMLDLESCYGQQTFSFFSASNILLLLYTIG